MPHRISLKTVLVAAALIALSAIVPTLYLTTRLVMDVAQGKVAGK